MEVWNYPSTTPYEEPCAQVGQDDYARRARQEARTLAAQIERMIGEPLPDALAWQIVANPHDFGSYYTLSLLLGSEGYFSAQEIREGHAYAEKVQALDDAGELAEWDETARQALAQWGDA